MLSFELLAWKQIIFISK